MNGNQEVFRRIEKKYIVDEPTYEKLIKSSMGILSKTDITKALSATYIMTHQVISL